METPLKITPKHKRRRRQYNYFGTIFIRITYILYLAPPARCVCLYTTDVISDSCVCTYNICALWIQGKREAFVILRTEPCCPFPPILRAEAQQQLPRGIMANFGQLFFLGGGQCIQRERSSRMKSKSVTLNLNLGYFTCRIPERFKVTPSLCYSYRRGEALPPLRKLDFAPEAPPPRLLLLH